MAGHFDIFKAPLAKEIGVILLFKLALLLGIRAVWFNDPVTVENDGIQVGQHLLGAPTVPPEKPAK